LNNKKIEN